MIATTTASSPVSSKVLPSHSNFSIDKNAISGLAYFDFPFIQRSLKVGDALSLKREKYSSPDRHRVGVYFCGRKLGHWPSPENKALANMIDKGLMVRGRIVNIINDQPGKDSEVIVESFVKM